jgi:hypothetical protein
VRTEEFITIDVVRHLLRVQGQINRLASEQDLQIMDLEAEIDRIRGEVVAMQRDMKRKSQLGVECQIYLAILGIILAVFISVFGVGWIPHRA